MKRGSPNKSMTHRIPIECSDNTVIPTSLTSCWPVPRSLQVIFFI